MLQRFVAFSVLCCKGLSYFSKAAFMVSECLFAGAVLGLQKFSARGVGGIIRSGASAKKKPRAFWNAELARFKEFFYAQSRRNSRKDRLL